MNNIRLPLLPPEIIRNHILIHLSIDDLQNWAKVSKVWQKYSSEIVAKRVKKISDIIPSKTFQEMKTMTRISAAGEFIQEDGQGGLDLSDFPDISTEDAAVLNTFESTFVPSKFGLGFDEVTTPTNDDGWSNVIPKSWLRDYAKIRGCGCPDEIEEIKCLINGLKFFPKFSLIVVPVRGNLAFFHEEDPINSLTNEGNKYSTPFLIEPMDFCTSVYAHSCISIYGERFVAQESAVCFILCRVTRVDHHGRNVEIQRCHRIHCHPFWSNSQLLYQETIYILDTIGQLIFWNEKTRRLTVPSEPLIPNWTEYPDRALFRINNLIMVKLSCGVDVSNLKHFTPPIWIMFDGDQEGEFSMVTVKILEDLIRHMLPTHLLNTVASVNRIDVWNNALIVQVSFTYRGNLLGGGFWSGFNTESMIFTFPMKRGPTLNDFKRNSDVRNLDLFYSVPDKTTPYFHMIGTTTAPFQVFKRNTSTSNKVGLILEYYLYRQPKEICVRNISIRRNEEMSICPLDGPIIIEF